MSEDAHQRVIDKLESVIHETRETMAAFEDTGMDSEMPADYERLHAILDRAVKDQKAHTLGMLGHRESIGARIGPFPKA